MRPSLSQATERGLQSASVNGDLFWSARDIVRNLGVFASVETVDPATYREIRNQSDFFAQPMLTRARDALEIERRAAEGQTDRLLAWASFILLGVLAAVAYWVFRPMEKAIRHAFAEAAQALFQGGGGRSRQI